MTRLTRPLCRTVLASALVAAAAFAPAAFAPAAFAPAAAAAAAAPASSSATTATTRGDTSGNSTSAAPGSSAPAAARAATFGIGPANTKGIDGRSALTFLASPGSRLTDRIAVVNLSQRTTALELYVRDATAGADGSIGYQPRATPAADAGTWIAPQTVGGGTTVTLRPRETRVIPIVITVPADASPGDHVAGILASLTSQIRSSAGKLSNFEQRIALRTSFRISGAVKPQLSVEDLDASYAGTTNPIGSGSATVTYTVRNTGNVTLGARQRVSVSGLFGEDTAPAVAAIPLLLPKASVRMSVTVPDVLPQVRLTGRVTLYPLVVKGSTAPGLSESFTASTGFWAVPWALLVLVVLVVLAVFGLRALRRRQLRYASRHGSRSPALS